MAINHVNGIAIRTTNVYPPIPNRNNDWQASYDGDEPSDGGGMEVGSGRTEQEAIDDLVANHPREPRFAVTSCSQCGKLFGPGNSGYSHCDQHRNVQIRDGLKREFDAAMPPKIALSGAIPSDYSEAVDRIRLATDAYLDFIKRAASPLSQYRDDKIAVQLDDCLSGIRDNVSDLVGVIEEGFHQAQEDAQPKARYSVRW